MEYSEPRIELIYLDSGYLLCGSGNSSMYEDDMGNGGFTPLGFNEE